MSRFRCLHVLTLGVWLFFSSVDIFLIYFLETKAAWWSVGAEVLAHTHTAVPGGTISASGQSVELEVSYSNPYYIASISV